MKLQLYSIATLTALFGMVFALVAGYMLYSGSWNLMFAIVFAIVINILMLFINPYIMDWTNKWFFKTKYYTKAELEAQGYKFVDYLDALSKEYNIKFPKIGIINDGSITAYTYGSRQNNARIVLTRGIIALLSEEELNAVIAHEFGHIKHRDFIVMTVASTLLQILYLIYINFRFASTRRSSSRDEGKSLLIIFAIISFIFYIIGTYVVLFLSRVREYYADKFAAQNSSPDALSNALVKIGYGIAHQKFDKQSMKIMESTRNMNLMDYKFSEGFSAKSDIRNAIKYDLFNPWATLLEFSSTHPLIGKRINAVKPIKLSVDKVTKAKLWSNFWTDIFVSYMNFFVLIILGIAAYMYPLYRIYIGITGIILSILIIAKIVNYRYPMKAVKKAKISELAADLYASPVKGKYVELDGIAIGKGTPGFALSEDFMLRDASGLVFINYEHLIGIMNWFVGYKKINKLLDHHANVKGWFLRNRMPYINAKLINNSLKSYIRTKAYFGVIKYFIVYVVIMLI